MVKILATKLAPEFSLGDMTDLLYEIEHDMKEQQLWIEQYERTQMEEEDKLSKVLQ